MVATLVIITGLAGLALAGVKNLTQEAIDLAEKNKLETALKTVLPEFDSILQNVKKVPITDKDTLKFYYAQKGGALVGTAVETFSLNGFSGKIRILVGFKPDGSIINTSVLEHAETPGLGDKMDASKSKLFPSYFEGFNPQDHNGEIKLKKDGGDKIDAITAATITSRAFCEALELAYMELLKDGGAKE